MKRYRVLLFEFDSTASWLPQEVDESWSEEVKESHKENQHKTLESFAKDYGEHQLRTKVENLREIGNLPPTILIGHNHLFRQARTSFVIGAYYPALTAVCALGERILNYLVLTLRQEYQDSPSYKSVHGKKSIDNWHVVIGALEEWEVLLPEVVVAFQELARLRNHSIHYNAGVAERDRELAIQAFLAMHTIIRRQFSILGDQPWFIPDIVGAGYISQEWESVPFIRYVYLPRCAPVSPYHSAIPDFETCLWDISEPTTYVDRVISDSEFADLLRKHHGR